MNEPHSKLPGASRTAWLCVLLLFPVALLNYLDRQMLASMQASVMASIPSLGEAENSQELWGLMLGQFKFVYAVFSLIGGYVADRFSRRLTICTSLLVWPIINWWTGQVILYNELLWARSLMGISEAFYIPAALALIADHHIGSTRSRAVGLHQIAIYLGVIVGGFGGYVAENPQLGWRTAFTVCGVVGILYAFPLLALLRDAPNRNKTVDTPAGDSPWGALRELILKPLSAVRELISNHSFLLLVLYFTLPAMAGWVVRDWMPAILKKEFHIGEGHAGVAATIYWQVAAIVGAFVGGWLADRWMRHSPRGRIYISAIGMCCIVPAIFGVGNAGSLSVAIVFLMLFGLGWGFFDGNNMPILAQVVRPNLRATGYGLMNFVSISCGGLADWGFGILRDRDVPLNVIFGIFASAAIVSVVLVLLIRPRPELAALEQDE